MNTRRFSLFRLGLLWAVVLGLSLWAVWLPAQVAVSPWKSPYVTFTDTNGVPLVGGCVFTYVGGTSTPLATYTDSSGVPQNPNPVILDATGSAKIWLGPSTYKFAIWSAGGTNCASGALQWTVDQVPGNIFNNTTVTGGTWSGGTITGAAISGGTITGAAITNSTIDSSPIGQTTPASGSFTSVASALNSMTFSSTPVFNAGAFGYFTMTLTNNVTSSSITGGTNGQYVTWNICQNGTGQTIGGITTGFTFAWPANFTDPPVINPILNACTIVQAYYNGGFWYTTSTSPQVIYGNFDTVPYSATPIFPATSYSNFAITLSANVTSSTLTGGVVGQVVTIDVCENATGTWTFIWPTNLLNAPPVSASASSCTGVAAVFNGTNWLTVSSSSVTSTTPITGNLDRIPFTATPTYSTSGFSSFEMTLSGNVTSSAIAGGTTGQLISIVLMQGSSTTTAPASAPTVSTLTTGGALPGTTTYFAKCAYLFGTVESLPSAEATETTGSGATNSITYNCPVSAGVTTYKFYIGTGTGAENFFFTTSSASYIQVGVPSTGTPGLPLTGSIYTVSWPANLINPPIMSTGIGASTGLIALFDGTNWITVGVSGSGSVSVNCTTTGCYRQNPDGSYEEWGITSTFGGADAGTATFTWPHAFTNVLSLFPLFGPTNCTASTSLSTCASGGGGSAGAVYQCAISTPSLTAPVIAWWSINTVASGSACYYHVTGQ